MPDVSNLIRYIFREGGKEKQLNFHNKVDEAQVLVAHTNGHFNSLSHMRQKMYKVPDLCFAFLTEKWIIFLCDAGLLSVAFIIAKRENMGHVEVLVQTLTHSISNCIILLKSALYTY